MTKNKKLIQLINEGIKSGICIDFDPIKHLEHLKSIKKNSLNNNK